MTKQVFKVGDVVTLKEIKSFPGIILPMVVTATFDSDIKEFKILEMKFENNEIPEAYYKGIIDAWEPISSHNYVKCLNINTLEYVVFNSDLLVKMSEVRDNSNPENPVHHPDILAVRREEMVENEAPEATEALAPRHNNTRRVAARDLREHAVAAPEGDLRDDEDPEARALGRNNMRRAVGAAVENTNLGVPAEAIATQGVEVAGYRNNNGGNDTNVDIVVTNNNDNND